MTETDKQRTGKWGEQQATSFLIKKGYEIVTHNFAIREGELDIIAWADKPNFGRTLCFVEVKTRGSRDGSAERSVGKGKLARLAKAGRAYCLEHNIDMDKTPIQFEQVSIYFGSAGPKFYHYEIPM